MPRYKFRLLRQMSVDGELRSPGEFVPEAASWSGLRHYLSLEWVEKLPAADDDPDAVEYPPAPRNKLAEILAPEGKPVELVVAWPRKKKRTESVRCRNCRVRNYLPDTFNEQASWLCHSCAQPQTIAQAKEYPSPTSLAEFAESVNARYVNEKGDLQHDQWLQRGSEDVTEEFKASVGR
jgi:hypothetical protein